MYTAIYMHMCTHVSMYGRIVKCQNKFVVQWDIKPCSSAAVKLSHLELEFVYEFRETLLASDKNYYTNRNKH
jgi:hypothetical protein